MKKALYLLLIFCLAVTLLFSCMRSDGEDYEEEEEGLLLLDFYTAYRLDGYDVPFSGQPFEHTLDVNEFDFENRDRDIPGVVLIPENIKNTAINAAHLSVEKSYEDVASGIISGIENDELSLIKLDDGTTALSIKLTVYISNTETNTQNGEFHHFIIPLEYSEMK